MSDRVSKMKKTVSSDSEDKLELPPEILTEILSRLPAKTLVKFRCVCKLWLSEIDNTDFISLHLRIFNNRSPDQKLQTLTLSHSDPCHLVRELVFGKHKAAGDLFSFPEDCDVKIKGYVNGLMLISANKNSLILVNPSIMKCLILPPCPLFNTRNSFLVKYPRVDVFLGFHNNDYKVVVHNTPMLQEDAAIYELSKGCWRMTKGMNYMRGLSLCTEGNSVFWKGSVYWVPGKHGDVKCKFLVSFDLDLETLRYKKLPGDWRKHWFYPFVFGESLAIYEEDYLNVYCYVWVMRDNDDEWTQCYSGKSVLHMQPLRQLFYVEPMDTLLFCTWLGVRFLRFEDTQPEEEDHPKDMWKPRRYTRIGFMNTYVESLVLAGGLEGQTVRPLSDLHNNGVIPYHWLDESIALGFYG